MTYECYVCKYRTDLKHMIHMHHIVPRANGGKNSKNNLVALCSKCHGLVYIPTETHGIHSKRGKDSFQIIAWRDSTRGKVLECKSLQTGEIYYI